MRAFTHPSRIGLPRTAGRYDASAVSPAALRIAQEADATMSPDGWETDYSKPELPAAEPLASSVLTRPGALPTT